MRIFRRRLPRSPLRRRKRRILLLILLLLGVLLLRLRWLPAIRRLAAMQADNETSDLINEAVAAYLDQTALTYADLVTLERDAEGAAAALQLNMPQANRMRAGILEQLSLRIPNLETQALGIPFGSVLLPTLLSGRGGRLPVRIVSLRNVNAEFESRFSQAGINQTLHRLELAVSVDLLLLTPAGFLESRVSTTVPVAQTVIVGGVPNLLMTGE